MLALDPVEHFPKVVLPISREWYSVYLMSLLMLLSVKNFCYFSGSAVIYMYGVAQSQTRLKRLSSSSSFILHFSDDCGWVPFVGHLYVVFCQVPVKSYYFFNWFVILYSEYEFCLCMCIHIYLSWVLSGLNHFPLCILSFPSWWPIFF